MELQNGVTYTGGVTIPAGTTACIKGNGAILDLQTSSIQVQGKGAVLDIDHCVITKGGDPIYGLTQAALNFVGGEGNIVSNTLYMNTVGIRIYVTAPGLILVKNNIVALNSQAGLLCQLYHEPQVLYNDCWGNHIDNYLIDCGWSGGVKSWTPTPGTGEISSDPLFVDASVGDFRLQSGSPCINAGDPAGTEMGAFDYVPDDVEPASWGRIKALFAK